MCYSHRDELAVGMIELVQLCIVGKLGVAPLGVILNGHPHHMLTVSHILKQPFQECVAKPVSSVWLRLPAVFTQNFVFIVKNNTPILTNIFQCLYARNNASWRNIWMLFIGDKQDVRVNYA